MEEALDDIEDLQWENQRLEDTVTALETKLEDLQDQCDRHEEKIDILEDEQRRLWLNASRPTSGYTLRDKIANWRSLLACALNDRLWEEYKTTIEHVTEAKEVLEVHSMLDDEVAFECMSRCFIRSYNDLMSEIRSECPRSAPGTNTVLE